MELTSSVAAGLVPAVKLTLRSTVFPAVPFTELTVIVWANAFAERTSALSAKVTILRREPRVVNILTCMKVRRLA